MLKKSCGRVAEDHIKEFNRTLSIHIHKYIISHYHFIPPTYKFKRESPTPAPSLTTDMRRATITKTLLWCRWWWSLLVDAWSLSDFDGSFNRKGKKERHNSCPQTRFSTESCDKGNHVLLPDFLSVTSYRRIVLHGFEILSVAKCISSFVSIKRTDRLLTRGRLF